MSYASLARPGEGHGLIADQQVGSCRVAGLVHSQETGSLPTDQSAGTRISERVTGKKEMCGDGSLLLFFP